MKRFCLEEMALQCVCARWRECEGCESLGPPTVAWPGPVLVPPLLSNHSEDQRPGTCDTAGAWEQRERCKGIINTKSRCHSKWLFLGGSECANIDWRVCVCVCKPEYHLRRGKRKRRSRADPLSLSEAPSSCNWILSLSHCCCLCGDWMVSFFPPQVELYCTAYVLPYKCII